MSENRKALCVSGPLAGRFFDVPPELRHIVLLAPHDPPTACHEPSIRETLEDREIAALTGIVNNRNRPKYKPRDTFMLLVREFIFEGRRLKVMVDARFPEPSGDDVCEWIKLRTVAT